MTLCKACEAEAATTDCNASCECPLCAACRASLDETRAELQAAYERAEVQPNRRSEA